ncbi:MAG TPA: hypothetical protein VFD48_00255 [Pyrinomonadaceae bacterium]|nr:hypothetical protein [Pyrinomonadaceae bacterium]
MRRWQKILFALIVLTLLSQLPFAYRRRRLADLRETIQQLAAQRNSSAFDPVFREYKGVVHVHSFLGGHSNGTLQEIVGAAKSNHLDFVVITEHTERDINTAAMTLQGIHDGVMFLNGNEVSVNNTGRVLLIPGLQSQSDASLTLEALAQQVRAKQGVSIVAYPQEFAGWNSNAFDGVEVYNLYTNARQINRVSMFFEGLWAYSSYPDLLFANFYKRPDENLRLWDQAQTRGQRLTALAGVDAHANVGLTFKGIGLQLDPYERSFQLVRVHLLIPQGEGLTAETVLKAVRDGHCFIGFDLFSDTTGFRFTGSSGSETKLQGDELLLKGEARLNVSVPLQSRIILLKNGTRIRDEKGKMNAEFVVTEPGNYRCEIYLPQLPHPVREEPWIISNPIYVR